MSARAGWASGPGSQGLSSEWGPPACFAWKRGGSAGAVFLACFRLSCVAMATVLPPFLLLTLLGAGFYWSVVLSFMALISPFYLLWDKQS